MSAKNREENKRLQRQEKLRQYGVDLPDIPGLPVEVIPLHVHAIKMTTKIFGKKGPYEKKAFRYESYRAFNEEPRPVGSLLLENILQRVEDSTHVTAERIESEILQKYQDGMQSWLNAIQRCVKDQKSRQTRDESSENVQHSSYSVPIAALQHLWSVHHKRLSVRRATQHLAGKLLEKSSDCRSWWFEEDDDKAIRRLKKTSVIEWMDNVLREEEEEETDENARRLWRVEAFDLLQNLKRKNYGILYPTLISAIQRFEQKCPANILSCAVDDRESTKTKSMTNSRYLRDTAVEQWDEMEKRIQKLTRKAKKCFDVLVPRIEDNVQTVRRSSAMTGDMDDEEEDIDWEDGLEDEATGDDSAIIDGAINHAQAVERTLEVMKNTGGMQEGRLEISIFSSSVEQNDSAGNNVVQSIPQDPQHTATKQTLDRVIRILSKNYMPRLSHWAEALTIADNLKVKRSVQSASDNHPTTDPLIQMTDREQIRRNEVLQSCLEAKREVAHILQSAKRLGVELVEASSSEAPEAPPQRSVLPYALQNARLSASLTGRKHLLGHRSRSTPLQIKFAKR